MFSSKEGFDVHLSIPVHKGRDLGVGLLRKLIREAGLTPEEYVAFFRGKKHSGR